MSESILSPAELQAALTKAVDPWLEHMRWRKNFAAWRERRLNQEQYQAERLQQVAELGGPLEQQLILDLGAGMGGFAVAAALAGATIAACEFNRAYCTIIKLRARHRAVPVPVYNAAGEALPFADQSFTTIVSWDVIEHVRAPQEVLAEFRRVLQPGGRVLLTAINRWAWRDPHYHLPAINWLPRPWAEALIRWRGRTKEQAAFRDMQRLSEMHYFSYPDFVRLAQSYGFRTYDLQEARLKAGTFQSAKRSRRVLRAGLRRLGLELFAYRLQRRWYTGMFELALVKE